MKQIKDIGKSIWHIFLFMFLSYSFLIPAIIFNVKINTADKTTSTLLLLFSDVLMVIVFGILYRKELKNDFKKFDIRINLKNNIKYYILGVIFMMIANAILIYGLKIGLAQNEAANRSLISNNPVYAMISILFTAPFIEEIVFKLNFNKLIKNDTLYIIITGIIFSAIHVIFSFENVIDLFYIIPYAGLGIGLSAIYRKSNNIFASIFFHCIHNAICVVLLLI